MAAVRPFGIYFLANDSVYDWLVAALESVRRQGARSPVVIIPFDGEISQIAKLASKYNFEFWQDDRLPALDAIGSTFFPDSIIWAHTFRKLAVFWGPLQDFFFIDADTVSLMNYDELHTGLDNPELELVFFDRDSKAVYADEEFKSLMLKTYGQPTFNTGAFLGRRGTFDRDQFTALAKEAIQYRAHFKNTGEQPFFNYCVSVKRLRLERAVNVVPEMHGYTWGGSVYKGRRDMFWQADQTGTFEHKRFPFIHWAGFDPKRSMPNARLFLKYRLLSASVMEKFRFFGRWYL